MLSLDNKRWEDLVSGYRIRFIAISRFRVLLLASISVVNFGLIAQNLPQTQSTPSAQSSAAYLQEFLDRDDYIAYSEAMAHVNAGSLTESQRQYFLGMLAFHLGKLDDAAPLLIKGVNINDKSLTSQQVESTLETLAQINLKLTYFGASAQMYDDIDKAWGSQMGDRAKDFGSGIEWCVGRLRRNEWRSREHPQRGGNTGTDVRCRRWRSVDRERSRTAAGLMFGKEGIRSLAYGTPKVISSELL